MTEILGILVALKKSQKYPSFPRNLFGFQHLIFSFLTIFFVTFFFWFNNSKQKNFDSK